MDGPGRCSRNVLEHAKELPETLYASIQEQLDGWIVTDGDVAKVIDKLEQLGPAAYRTAIERMEKNGLLAKLVEELPPELRTRFLQQAAEKGYIRTEPREVVKGTFDPPQPPLRYHNEPGLPMAMRNAIYQELRTEHRSYAAQYQAYMERYADGIAAARSGEDVRSIGEWVKPESLSEAFPAGDWGGAYLRERGDREPIVSDMQAAKALRAKMVELRGEDETLALKLSAELKAPIGTHKVEVTLSERGAEHKSSLRVEGSVHDVGRSVDVDSKGEVTQKVSTPVGALEGDAKGLKKVEVTTPVGGASVDRDGKVTLKGPKIGGGGTSANGSVAVNPKEGTFGGGVEINIGGNKFKAFLAMNGISEMERKMFNHPDGAFAVPRELSAGTSWEALPLERRLELVFYGWTQDEWTRKLPRG